MLCSCVAAGFIQPIKKFGVSGNSHSANRTASNNNSSQINESAPSTSAATCKFLIKSCFVINFALNNYFNVDFVS